MKTPPIQERIISKNYHPYTITNRSVEGVAVIDPANLKKLKAKYAHYREMVSIIDHTKNNSKQQHQDIVDPSYSNKIEAIQKDNRVHIQIKDPRHLNRLEARRILQSPQKMVQHLEKITKRAHIQQIAYDLKGAQSDKQIKDELKQLIRILRRGTLKALMLCDRDVTDRREYTDIKSICRALQRNHSLKSLSLTGFGARSISLYFFTKFLRRHKNLRELNLDSFNIDSKGLRYISKSLIGGGGHLETLKINTSRYNSEFSIQSIEKLAATIEQHKSLKILDIDMPDLPEGRLALLAIAIKNNPNIKTVSLALPTFCRISELIPLLEDSTNLTELVLNSVKGDSAVQVVSQALAKNKSITTIKLHLQDQQIFHKTGTKLQLVDRLESNSRAIGYKSECVRIPPITVEGLERLRKMLEDNTMITSLNIYGDLSSIENKVLEAFMTKTRDLLQRNKDFLKAM